MSFGNSCLYKIRNTVQKAKRGIKIKKIKIKINILVKN